MDKHLTPLSARADGRGREYFSQHFLLWLVLLSIAMFFAALTSAYLVKSGERDFLMFSLPLTFFYTTLIVSLSSISMQMAYYMAKKNHILWLNGLLTITLLLGIGFIWGQFIGWEALVLQDIYFVGNPGGSFIYVISGMHALHVLAGLVYLLYILIKSLNYQIHSENMRGLKMCATYWHFIGLLWVYLYVFFQFV